MSQKQNNDFLYSVQIPNFLSSEKCDELLKDIMESEQDVIGCVGDEKGQTQSYQKLEKLMSGIYVNKKKINSDQQTKQRLEMVTGQNVSKWPIL